MGDTGVRSDDQIDRGANGGRVDERIAPRVEAGVEIDYMEVLWEAGELFVTEVLLNAEKDAVVHSRAE